MAVQHRKGAVQRRRVAKIDDERRDKAARQVQRAVRKYRSVCNWQDPATLSTLTRKESFSLVEPNGSTYLFDVRTLAQMCLAAGNFTHPYTRRVLLLPEVLRLARRLPKQGRNLLLLTWKYRDVIQERIEQQRSLCAFLEGDCGRFWNVLLEAEEAEEHTDCICVWFNYEDSFRRLAKASPLAAADNIALHREQLEQRAVWLSPEFRGWLSKSLERLEEDHPRPPRNASPLSGLELVVASALPRLKLRVAESVLQ